MVLQRGFVISDIVFGCADPTYKHSHGCHTPENSWKFEILLKTSGKTFFFSISPRNLLENYRVTRFWDFCEFCEVSVVLMRKKMVLLRIKSRMGSLITCKHCRSLANLISVWNRFSDKIKHCLE